jgi:ubiquinone/menaquinone biosynthesis C-methylase UbiE
MEAQKLKSYLHSLEKERQLSDWTNSLTSRKRAELEFHNRDRDKELMANLPQDTYELLYGNKKYYGTTNLSRSYIDNWLATEAPGKVFLDYACGNGAMALAAAHLGADVAIGVDISDVSIRNARENANAAGVGDRCVYLQGDCENTGLPDNSIDVILCSGMLHHLDLSFAFPELRRVLRPGGKILCVEALNYNPVIKAYRLMTPSMRTDWEKNHILSLRDVRFAKRFFEVEDIRYWHVLSVFAAYFTRFPRLMGLLQGMADSFDQVLTRVPLAQLMAWQFTFVLVKHEER